MSTEVLRILEQRNRGNAMFTEKVYSKVESMSSFKKWQI